MTGVYCYCEKLADYYLSFGSDIMAMLLPLFVSSRIFFNLCCTYRVYCRELWCPAIHAEVGRQGLYKADSCPVTCIEVTLHQCCVVYLVPVSLSTWGRKPQPASCPVFLPALSVCSHHMHIPHDHCMQVCDYL